MAFITYVLSEIILKQTSRSREEESGGNILKVRIIFLMHSIRFDDLKS